MQLVKWASLCSLPPSTFSLHPPSPSLLLLPLFTPTAHSSSHTVEFPILTFSSGPTNSMRGAMWLSGLRNALVVDVGGTSTDIGTLKDGFPREASTQREVRPPGGEWGDSVLW